MKQKMTKLQLQRGIEIAKILMLDDDKAVRECINKSLDRCYTNGDSSTLGSRFIRWYKNKYISGGASTKFNKPIIVKGAIKRSHFWKVINMIFTEEQSETILTNPKNLVNQFEKNESSSRIEQINRFGNGRTNGHFTTEERILIGTVARAGLGTQKEIAAEFDVHRQYVGNLKYGRLTQPTSATFKPHPELEAAIAKQTSNIEEKAIDLLMRSMGVISDEKLEKTSAKDASTIALNASRIVQNCRPDSVQDNRLQVVLYAPKLKTIEDFKVVEI